MPCDYHINVDEELVTITSTQDVELAYAMQFGRSVLDDAKFKSTLPQLIDLRGLVIHGSGEQLSQFQNFVLHEYGRAVESSVAIVVDDSLGRYELAALYRLITQTPKAEMFDNYELALKWLMRTEFALKTTPDSQHKSRSP